MYKEALQQVAGVDRFGIISLLLFLSAFVLVLLWAIRLDRRQVERYSRMPLEPDVESPASTGASHG